MIKAFLMQHSCRVLCMHEQVSLCMHEQVSRCKKDRKFDIISLGFV